MVRDLAIFASLCRSQQTQVGIDQTFAILCCVLFVRSQDLASASRMTDVSSLPMLVFFQVSGVGWMRHGQQADTVVD